MRNFKQSSILAIAPLSLILTGISNPFPSTIAQLSEVFLSKQPVSARVLTASAVPQPVQMAQQSRVRRIRFAPGAVSATIEDAVVRGTRDTYLVGASQGQTMTIKIASLESNAVFELKAPPNKVGQRRTLKPEAIRWTGVLPQTGDYQIIVGGTRGNASYKLQVTIK